MTRIPVTGSKAHRVWKCPASAVLPQIVSDDADAKHEPARARGKDIHRFLERVKVIGRAQAMAEAPADLAPVLAALDLANLPVHLATEVAFALNWQTGTARELGRNLGHRDYASLENPPDPTCETAMTLDLVGTQEHGGAQRGYVGDYKGGHSVYPPPERFAQLLLGALAARAVYGCDEVVVELIRIHDDGTHHRVRAVLDAWDLDAFAAEWRAVMESLPVLEAAEQAGRALPLHEGAHCDYCGAYKNCAAKVALVKAVPAELIQLGVQTRAVPALHPLDREELALALAALPAKAKGRDAIERILASERSQLEVSPGAITASNAAAVYEACERLDDIIGKLKTEVCQLGWVHPIPLSDGRVIEPHITERRAIHGKIAAAVLEKRYGREAALSVIDIETSIAAIRRLVVMKKAPDEKIQTRNKSGVLDSVIAEIDRAGGLVTNSAEVCKPHQPRKNGKS